MRPQILFVILAAVFLQSSPAFAGDALDAMNAPWKMIANSYAQAIRTWSSSEKILEVNTVSGSLTIESPEDAVDEFRFAVRKIGESIENYGFTESDLREKIKSASQELEQRRIQASVQSNPTVGS